MDKKSIEKDLEELDQIVLMAETQKKVLTEMLEELEK